MGISYIPHRLTEVMNPLVFRSSSSSPTQPPAKKFHSNLIPSTPRNFQPFPSSVPSSVHHPSPKSFTNSTAQAITSPQPPSITTCGQHQPKKRESITFAIPSFPSVSKSGALASQG
ncbi:hypothetical protein O181_031033 [Austropuccinia psidii MF-1]|uniref:Uncharacterized protein n=1 Tax=Austropuccinia psidii MF-1 TaxID=1389203 RepID=A0A9Q3H481_9BASI|nr:hypothetical protein [Austropuccinia psidii MF-1]